MLICGKSDAQVYKATKGPGATMHPSESQILWTFLKLAIRSPTATGSPFGRSLTPWFWPNFEIVRFSYFPRFCNFFWFSDFFRFSIFRLPIFSHCNRFYSCRRWRVRNLVQIGQTGQKLKSGTDRHTHRKTFILIGWGLKDFKVITNDYFWYIWVTLKSMGYTLSFGTGHIGPFRSHLTIWVALVNFGRTQSFRSH